LLGKMDVIFCRNVIIYFDQAGKRNVIENFFQRLLPEGFLLLGHSESLINLSTAFRLRHFQHDMVYQKPEAANALAGGV
jgi:chemotaxis protein methyltransferase CheR